MPVICEPGSYVQILVVSDRRKILMDGLEDLRQSKSAVIRIPEKNKYTNRY